MFDRIFGKYLVSKECITAQQLEQVLMDQKNAHVKLGVIAVSDKMMTKEQTDEINHLQSITDRRFGDLAVEKGYLSEEQVGRLLKKQGNICLHFIQSIIDAGFMTLEEIDEELENYQDDMGLTNSDMDDLVSGDIGRAVGVFLPSQDEMYGRLCGVAVRTLLRLIDSTAYVEKAYVIDKIEVDNLAMQKSDGNFKVYTGFAGKEKNLLSIAVPYAKEEFEHVDLDALDAIGEFINCIDGLFASELSNENVDIDMLPPSFYEKNVTIQGDYFCVLPIVIQNNKIELVVAIDSDITVK